MPISPSIAFAGQTHVFQVNNVLWHKWSSGHGWSNESVFTAAGLGYAPLSYQTPGVSIVNGQMTVAVEDTSGRAWYFVQSPGGPWEAAELP